MIETRRDTRWRNQIILLFACGLLLSLGSGVAGQQRPPDNAENTDELPVYARYDILFRRLTAQPNQSQTSEGINKQGEPPQYLSILQHTVPLNDEQANALKRIAVECMQRVRDIDSRAREIIRTHRAADPPRPLTPGEQRPAPPRELQTLQQERNNLILEAREQVRLAFGEAEFQRFEQYINSHGNGRRFTMPSANKQPLPIQVTVTAVDSDGTPTKQFSVGARVFIQVTMINNSAQMITVKRSELDDWFQLLRLKENGETEEFPLPLPDKSQEENKRIPPVEVQPKQLVVVRRIEMGGGLMKLAVGSYRFTPRDELVLLNRPPDASEILRFSVLESEAVTFQIVR